MLTSKCCWCFICGGCECSVHFVFRNCSRSENLIIKHGEVEDVCKVETTFAEQLFVCHAWIAVHHQFPTLARGSVMFWSWWSHGCFASNWRWGSMVLSGSPPSCYGRRLYDVWNFITGITNEWIYSQKVWELLTDQYITTKHSLDVSVVEVSRIIGLQLFRFNLCLNTTGSSL